MLPLARALSGAALANTPATLHGSETNQERDDR
jgi:hypothetical protein